MNTSRRHGAAAYAALRLVTALVLTLVSLLPSARPATSQEYLLWSSPSDGVVAEAPAAVSLRFSRSVVIGSALITVATPDGSTLPPAVERVQGSRVDRALPTGLTSGPYRVAWTVRVDDGHRLSGTTTFIIEAGPPVRSRPDGVAPSGPTGAEPDGLPTLAAVGWIGCAAGLLLLGLWFSRRRPGRSCTAGTDQTDTGL